MTSNRCFSHAFGFFSTLLLVIFISHRPTVISFTAVPVPTIRLCKSCSPVSFVLRMAIDNEARKLLEKAETLRKEVAIFQKEKDDAIKAEQGVEQQAMAEQKEVRMRYSAEVPILKGDGSTVVERCDFPPRFPKDTSIIESIEAYLPLGIILGEDEEIPGAIRVDEVVENGNGYLSGVREGMLLRACTACQMTMETPTWQIIAGGIGQPRTKRFMYSVDGRPFEEVMEAVASNRMDPEKRSVVMVLETRDN